MAVATTELRPFTSLLLAHRPSQGDPDGFIAQALGEVKEILATGEMGRRTFTDIGLPDRQHRLWAGWLSYRESRAPTWAPASDLRDEVNHLVVVAVRAKYVAVYTSDPWMARKLAKPEKLDAAGFQSLEPIPVGTINTAFAHPPTDPSSDGDNHFPIRTLWLAGIHRPTESKPDSKVLTGLDLSFALDPLGDQSYAATAARTEVELPNLPRTDRNRTVGFNSRKSRVWAGPTHDWDEFTKLVYAILGQVRRAMGEEPDLAPVPVLASPVNGPADLAGAYDMSLIAPELLSDTINLPPHIEQLATKWAYDARFDITPLAGTAFEANVFLNDHHVGTLTVEPTVDKTGAATLHFEDVEPSNLDLTEVRDVCLDHPSWLTVRYESGHALVNGVVYSTRFRDLPFTGWQFWPMPGIDVTKEKPPESRSFDPQQIGLGDSLFCWVQRNWPPPLGATSGWLACDDGAGEIADFIHVDTTARSVTLIHVKASHSDKENRQISTSDYEVVVGQAVKNLRHLDRINLADQLDIGKDRGVAWATWHDGARDPSGRTELIKAVRALGTNYSRHVVVLQPRMRAPEYQEVRKMHDRGETNGRVRRLQQLDALLLEAQSACRDLGADFLVIGEATLEPSSE